MRTTIGGDAVSVVIHRTRTQGFSMLPNRLLRDERMSLKSRGLLATLLSHEDGWQQSIAYLQQECRDGKDAIWSGLRELEDLGYLVRRRRRTERGAWLWDHHVYDAPEAADAAVASEPSTGNPSTGNPPEPNVRLAENPSTGNPSMGNPGIGVEPLDVEPQYEDQELKPSATQASPRATSYSQAFEAFWNLCPVKRDKGKAYPAWRRAIKRATADEINAGMVRYVAWLGANPDVSPKYPEGWLNGDRWLDELGDDAGDRMVARLRALKGEKTG